VDGNVRRVVIRLLNDNGADVEDASDRLLDRGDPGRWNQAMMELGATVCVPRDPHCSECPVARQCEARKHGTQNELPKKRVKPVPLRLTRTLLVIGRKKRILLVPSSRVKDFWELPEPFEGAQAGNILREFRHTITHRHYRFIVREAHADATLPHSQWFSTSQIETIPLSTIAKKALAWKDGRISLPNFLID